MLTKTKTILKIKRKVKILKKEEKNKRREGLEICLIGTCSFP